MRETKLLVVSALVGKPSSDKRREEDFSRLGDRATELDGERNFRDGNKTKNFSPQSHRVGWPLIFLFPTFLYATSEATSVSFSPLRGRN